MRPRRRTRARTGARWRRWRRASRSGRRSARIRTLDEQLRELRERVVGEDDVVARMQVVELLLELVQLAVVRDDDAADIGPLGALEVHLDGVREERPRKGRERP